MAEIRSLHGTTVAEIFNDGLGKLDEIEAVAVSVLWKNGAVTAGCPPGYGMRGTPPRPPASSRAACGAPASRRAALLAGNLARPSYGARNRAREY